MSVVASYDGKQNFSILNVSILTNKFEEFVYRAKEVEWKIKQLLSVNWQEIMLSQERNSL